jgi:hypothetical protein
MGDAVSWALDQDSKLSIRRRTALQIINSIAAADLQ